jgi:hypothetical protein
VLTCEIMKRATALFFALLAGPGCAETTPARGIAENEVFMLPWWGAEPPPKLTGLPYAVSVQAAELVHRGAHLDSVWPGFDIPTEFILCPSSGGTLIALQEPLSIVASVVASVIGSPSREKSPAKLYYVDERLAGLGEPCIDFDYELEGRSLLAFPEVDSIGIVSDPVDATASGVIHDEFHRYQIYRMRRFKPMRYAGSVRHGLSGDTLTLEIVSAPEFRRLAVAERDILAGALQSDTFDDTVALKRELQRYLAIREQRMSLIPAGMDYNELFVERLEGSAHLVGYQAMIAARGGSAEQLRHLLVRELQATPPFERSPQLDWHRQWHRHWHVYATGAALGVLFDRLGMEWRLKMEEGATFLDLVREAVE